MNLLTAGSSIRWDGFDPKMTGSNYDSEVVLNNQGGKMMVLISFLVGVLSLNYLLYGLLLSNMMTRQLSSIQGTVIFAILTAAVFGAGHYILTYIVGRRSRDSKGIPSFFVPFYKSTRAIFYVSAVIHGIIILQMVFTSQYYVALSIGTMAASFILGSIVSAYMSYRFLSWYKARRETPLLLYGITFSAIAATLILTALVNTAAIFLSDPLKTEGSDTGIAIETSTGNVRDSFSSALFLVTQTPSRIAFVLYWAGTALLLRNYIKAVGRIRFWLIISMPLVIFLIATIFIFGNIANTQFLRIMLILNSSLLSGIMFAFIFMTTSKSLGRMKHTDTAHYLTLSGFGTLLYVISSSAPVHVVDWLHTPYPAFASSGWSFVCVAIFLYSFGISYSASAISRDVQLRKSIKKIAAEEARLFGTIGTAQMESEMTAKISKIVEEQKSTLEKQAGVLQDVDESEIKSYLNEALEEVKKAKKGSG